MGARNYVRTITDLEKLYYSPMGAQFIQKQAQWVTKDADVLTTTTGVYNAIYGTQVWHQLNTEANVFALLPKYPWRKSGWRIITARGGTLGTGGLAEDAALPATIKPTFKEVSTKPKTVAHTFSTSEVQEYLASESEDDSFGAMAQMRPLLGTEHKEHINKMLCKDYDTLASNNFESLDRVCASATETTNAGYTVGDEDMYNIDRSSDTVYDAYVDENSGTDRSLTDAMLRSAFDNIGENGGNTTVVVTGHDGYASIQGLFEAQVRYTPLGESTTTIGVNGVGTDEGLGVGIKVATLYGVPIIRSKDVEKDTISRIMFLDTSDPEGFGTPRLGIMVAKPTQYFEAGMLTGDPFGINRLGTEGMFRTMGELICRNFKAQGKIRDLK